MKTSEQINEIAAAMAKAQGELKPAKLDSVNPHYKSKYSSLFAMEEALQNCIPKMGLSKHIDPSSDPNGVSGTLRIHHTSGQWYEFGPFWLPVVKKDAHGYGSALTYLKRQLLAAAFGISCQDEDDDGNESIKESVSEKINTKKREEHTPISKEQFAEVMLLIQQCDEQFVEASYKRIKSEGAKGWESMPAKLFPIFKEAAERHIAKKQHEVANAK